MRILIIEDEITLNRTLQEGLTDFGYQVDTAENYKDAEYFIDIRNYDLVLTDWMLPDGDGIELCKIVKIEVQEQLLLSFLQEMTKKVKLKH